MAKSCRLLLPLLPLTSAFIASGPSSSFLHFRGVDSVSGLAQPVAFRLGSSAGILAPRLASSTRALSLRGGAAGVVCADDTSRTRYNFAAASGREGELVFGCERPGAADEFNKVDGIAPNEVRARRQLTFSPDAHQKAHRKYFHRLRLPNLHLARIRPVQLLEIQQVVTTPPQLPRVTIAEIVVKPTVLATGKPYGS